jgi:hypothetical protein
MLRSIRVTKFILENVIKYCLKKFFYKQIFIFYLQAQTLKSVLFLHVIVIVTSWDNVT